MNVCRAAESMYFPIFICLNPDAPKVAEQGSTWIRITATWGFEEQADIVPGGGQWEGGEAVEPAHHLLQAKTHHYTYI